jgi:hypothetical protein
LKVGNLKLFTYFIGLYSFLSNFIEKSCLNYTKNTKIEFQFDSALIINV